MTESLSKEIITLPSAFLSYAREDETFARRIYEALIEEGFRVWWDRVSMPSRGLTFTQEIARAIDDHERLIVLLTRTSIEKDYVVAEWKHAVMNDKVVTPLLLGDDHSIVPDDLADYHCQSVSDHESAWKDVRTDIVRLASDPPPPLARLRGMPPRVNRLVRRSDAMAAVGRLLVPLSAEGLARNVSAQTVILTGLPGVGKSVLASEVARKTSIRRAFPDGIYWLTLDNDSNTSDVLTWLSQYAFGWTDVSMPDAGMVDKLQGRLGRKSVLIVADNVWNIDQVSLLLRIVSPQSRLLITTRRQILGLKARPFEVSMFEPADALSCLAEWAEVDSKSLPSAAAEVASECGYHPFALALAGATHRSGRSWDDIVKSLRASDLTYMSHAVSGYEYRDLLRMQATSLDFLRNSPELIEQRAAELYMELAAFRWNRSVPEAAITTRWLAGEGRTERQAQVTLSVLAEMNLLRADGESPQRIVRLHDLQHDFLRYSIPNLASEHSAILDAYAHRYPGGPSVVPTDGYYLQNLTHHLDNSERSEELYSLINESWMTHVVSQTDSPRLFAIDAQLARDHAAKQVPANLVEQIRCALVMAHLAALSEPDGLLHLWTRLGQVERALGHAYLHDSFRERASALTEIVGALAADGAGERAREIADEAVKCAQLIPDEVQSKCALKAIASALATGGDAEHARDVAGSLKGRDLDEAYKGIAVALVSTGRCDEAVQFAAVIKDSSRASFAWGTIAEALAREGRHDDAFGIIEQHTAGWDRDWQFGHLAIELGAAGDHEHARHTAARIANEGYQAEIIAELATKVYDSGDFAATNEMLVRAWQLAGDSENAYNQRAVREAYGVLLARAGLVEEAIECAETLGKGIPILDEVARTLALQGQLQEAVSLVWDPPSDRKPRMFRLARVVGLGGRDDDLNYILERPGSDEYADRVLSEIAVALGDRGELVRAVGIADRIQDKPTRKAALVELARARIEVGALSDARRLSGLAVSVGVTDSFAPDAHAKILGALATALFNSGEPAAAVLVADDAVRLAEKNHASGLDHALRALARTGRPIQALTQVTQVRGTHYQATVVAEVATALARRGNVEGALQAIAGKKLDWQERLRLVEALADCGFFHAARQLASESYDKATRAAGLVALARRCRNQRDFASGLVAEALDLLQSSYWWKTDCCGPQGQWAQLELGKALVESGNLERAEHLGREHPSLLIGVASALIAAGDVKGAIVAAHGAAEAMSPNAYWDRTLVELGWVFGRGGLSDRVRDLAASTEKETQSMILAGGAAGLAMAGQAASSSEMAREAIEVASHASPWKSWRALSSVAESLNRAGAMTNDLMAAMIAVVSAHTGGMGDLVTALMPHIANESCKEELLKLSSAVKYLDSWFVSEGAKG